MGGGDVDLGVQPLPGAAQARPPRARSRASSRPRRAAESRPAAGSPARRRRARRRPARRRWWRRSGAPRAPRRPRRRRASPRCCPSSSRTARSCRASSTPAARSRARATIGREARSPSTARASAPPIAEPPIPATTSPPGASWGSRLADSTRHSASRRWSGRARMSSIWPDWSIAATASRVRSALTRQNLIAPSGSSTPGKIRAPAASTLSGPTLDALAEHDAGPRCGSDRRSRAPGPMIAPRTVVPRAHAGAVEQHRALDVRPAADRDACAEHGPAADDRPGRDLAAGADERRARPRALDPGAVEQRQPGLAQPAPSSVLDVALEDVVGRPAGSARACRCPASSRRPRSRTGRCRRAREHLALDRDVACRPGPSRRARSRSST